MPKQAKYTVDFFPHDCFHRMTLFIVEQKYGNDGFALWFKLLETLGASKGHFLDLNKENNVQFLSSKSHLTQQLCFEILECLADLDAIDKTLWGHKIIWSQNFVDRLSKVYSDRRCPLPPKPIIKNSDNGHIDIIQVLHDNTDDYGVNKCNTDDSDIFLEDIAESEISKHKLKESRLKETKLKETKEKKMYATSVFLSELEYLALIDKFGKRDTDKKIEALSLYKQSSGKKYKSDYFTILNWARKDEDISNKKHNALSGHAGMDIER